MAEQQHGPKSGGSKVNSWILDPGSNAPPAGRSAAPRTRLLPGSTLWLVRRSLRPWTATRMLHAGMHLVRLRVKISICHCGSEGDRARKRTSHLGEGEGWGPALRGWGGGGGGWVGKCARATGR